LDTGNPKVEFQVSGVSPTTVPCGRASHLPAPPIVKLGDWKVENNQLTFVCIFQSPVLETNEQTNDKPE